MVRSQALNAAKPVKITVSKVEDPDKDATCLSERIDQLQTENHSIRARLSAVQLQIQEINQVNEILLFVQQQIMSSIGAMTTAEEVQVFAIEKGPNDDDLPN